MKINLNICFWILLAITNVIMWIDIFAHLAPTFLIMSAVFFVGDVIRSDILEREK